MILCTVKLYLTLICSPNATTNTETINFECLQSYLLPITLQSLFRELNEPTQKFRNSVALPILCHIVFVKSKGVSFHKLPQWTKNLNKRQFLAFGAQS